MDYTGILIERNDGKMLFQLRDNNPNIENRNCWSLFGGGINKNETPVEAAVRELKEELGINVKKEQLYSLLVFPTFNKKSYLFKLKLNKNIRSMKLKEGNSMRYFSLSEIIREKNIVKSLRLLLFIYLIISLIKK